MQKIKPLQQAKFPQLYLYKAVFIGAVPGLVFLGMRLYVRSFLNLQLGYGAIGTDFDFLPHMYIAYVLALFILQYEHGIQFTLQKHFLWGLVSSLLVFALFTSSFRSSISHQYPVALGLWFMLASVPLLLSVLLYLAPISWSRAAQRNTLLCAACVGFSGIISNTLLRSVARPLTQLTGWVTFHLIKIVVPALSFTQVGEFSVIDHSLFAVSIGIGCSGMEGISLFIFVLGLFLVATQERFSFLRFLKLCTVGIVFMFLLNVFRLGSFFLFSLLIAAYFGNSAALASGALFHKGVGFVVYSFGIFIFFDTVLWLRRNHSLMQFAFLGKVGPCHP